MNIISPLDNFYVLTFSQSDKLKQPNCLQQPLQIALKSFLLVCLLFVFYHALYAKVKVFRKLELFMQKLQISIGVRTSFNKLFPLYHKYSKLFLFVLNNLHESLSAPIHFVCMPLELQLAISCRQFHIRHFCASKVLLVTEGSVLNK